MKVAYVLNTPNAANYKVGEMILPQLESDSHGVDVVGIFFFDDNTMLLQKAVSYTHLTLPTTLVV